MTPSRESKSQRGPSQRQLRVGEALRHALARILASGELRDPALNALTLTVTEVRVSPDLKNAAAFVVPLGGEGIDEAVAALNRAGGFFRGQIAQEVVLRHAPSVTFVADRSFDQAGRIEEILRRERVRQDLAPSAQPGEDDDGA